MVMSNNSAINRYYKSAAAHGANSSLMTNGNISGHKSSNLNNYSSMATVQNQSTSAATQATTDQVKSLSTKNQMSKTSIELEYSKFESSSNGNGAAVAKQQATTAPANGSKVVGHHLGPKVLSSIQSHQ